MLSLCSDSHEEICYDGPKCPICPAIRELEDTIEAKDVELDDLQVRIGELECELEMPE